MEVLLQELQLVSNASPHGSHDEVAEIIGISTEYLYNIRKGKQLTVNSAENREYMKNLISEYRAIIRRESQRLADI